MLLLKRGLLARLMLLLQDNSAHKVAETILGPRNKAVLYAKHMAKHKIGLDQSLMQRSTHMVGDDQGARCARGVDVLQSAHAPGGGGVDVMQSAHAPGGGCKVQDMAVSQDRKGSSLHSKCVGCHKCS